MKHIQKNYEARNKFLKLQYTNMKYKICIFKKYIKKYQYEKKEIFHG